MLCIAVFHFVGDGDDPTGIVARYREAMAPGSYLALTHATDEMPPDVRAKLTQVYSRSTSGMVMRTPEQVRKLFDGFEVVEPGLVALPEWRPREQDRVKSAVGTWGRAGVGRKP